MNTLNMNTQHMNTRGRERGRGWEREKMSERKIRRVSADMIHGLGHRFGTRIGAQISDRDLGHGLGHRFETRIWDTDWGKDLGHGLGQLV